MALSETKWSRDEEGKKDTYIIMYSEVNLSYFHLKIKIHMNEVRSKIHERKKYSTVRHVDVIYMWHMKRTEKEKLYLRARTSEFLAKALPENTSEFLYTPNKEFAT